MPYCRECGKEYSESNKFCSSCGAFTDTKSETFNPQHQTYQNLNMIHPQDIQENKIFSSLCYIGILLLIPLLAAPHSRYIRFHANQGIVLIIFNLIISAFPAILNFGIFGIFGIFGWMVPIVGWIISTVLFWIGIINALSGKTNPLPIIGRFTVLK